MREITLAVLGDPGAGKSSLIQSALDLRKPTVSPFSSKKVSLEGIVSILCLIELQLEDVGISEGCNILWPTKVGHQALQRIDGALVLHDVTVKNSISRIYDLLSTLKLRLP